MSTPNWMDRYLSGAHEEVWTELRQYGARVREPHLIVEAQAVCDEMARRARHNLETLIGRLDEQGYRFHTNDDAQDPVAPLLPSSPHADRLASWLEETLGPIPLALSSWLRIVGDVWLVGTHPDWPESASADPLVIELEFSRYPEASTQDYYLNELEAWEEANADSETPDAFVLPVAPDRLHKANISGGPPYGFRLPDATAEGLFIAESPMPFVSYLNDVFTNGGFPGPATTAQQRRIKDCLAEGMLAL
ncbi:hypothetical protein [Propioniciclava tarda]|uniref:Uncharacterized protein n=1 Tax=Propioniciclava tarda TaxID=433330 RepID=A0A4Q9KLJ1_PROTD|nr:hypothetical protein [Propioniciclava tarda]TBT95095.1 hypothetical protein ET996_07490 [Propioniciclava tarda]SMO55869.1 hypothetical protein SAMN06266982_106107 [Propioniciclava tarda]